METQNSQNWLETRQKRNKANSSQEANEDRKKCFTGGFLIRRKKQPKANPCPRKEAFGSYGEPLLLSAASVLSTVVFSKSIIHQKSAFV
jgi:hypothetical protein